MPSSYPLTKHQLDVIEVSKECGIEKGMKREDLVEKMKTCVPEAWKKRREAKNLPSDDSGEPG